MRVELFPKSTRTLGDLRVFGSSVAKIPFFVNLVLGYVLCFQIALLEELSLRILTSRVYIVIIGSPYDQRQPSRNF